MTDKNIANFTTKVSYKGALRTESTHQKSGQEIVTDAPTDNNGKGQAHSPTDLVATALASCMLTIMGISAQKRGFELPETVAEVKKIMISEPRRIARVEVTIYMKSGNLDDKQKALLEKVALTCPVAKSLSADLEQVVLFKYD